jgi:formylglycine-generating enzyme required for sulfatase activity
VTIAGLDIEMYEKTGVSFIDDQTYAYVVTRRRAHPGIIFASLPSGTFQMGDVEDGGYLNEKPVHTVTLSGFEMSVYEITNAQYAQFLNEALTTGDITVIGSIVKGVNGIYRDAEYIYLGGINSSYPDTRCWITYNYSSFHTVIGHENWPVVWVTWYGAKAFALYYGLDVPTEAEWEYACRGGKQYTFGTDDGTLNTNKANYWNTGIRHPAAAGSYPPNPFGLYDLSGNVSEWCHDWLGTYPGGSVNNPCGLQTGACRTVRGGSWDYDSTFCRSANRNNVPPYEKDSDIGFRVVRRISPMNY